MMNLSKKTVTTALSNDQILIKISSVGYRCVTVYQLSGYPQHTLNIPDNTYNLAEYYYLDNRMFVVYKPSRFIRK